MSRQDTPPAAGGLWLETVRIRGDEFPHRAEYPFDVPALQGQQELQFGASIAFLVGENGSGKSTLIEAIARRCGLHLWSQPKRSRLGAGTGRPAAFGGPACVPGARRAGPAANPISPSRRARSASSSMSRCRGAL